MLQNNLKQISLLIGNMFMPMIQTVMPYINAMAIAVKDLVQWISNLLGLKWENTAQAAPDMSEYDTGYDDIASDAEDAADATDKATDAQKKYNKQLAKFDELTNYTFSKTKDSDKNKDKDKDENNADVSGVLSNALIAAVQDYEKQWNKAFQSMENSAANLAKTIEDLFKRAWNTGDGTEIGEAIAETLNKGIDWVNNHTDQFSNGLNKIASILGTTLNGFVEKFDFPGLGKAIGNSIKAALEAEKVFFDTVNWTNLGKRIAESLNAFVDSGVIQQYFETAASKINAAIGTALGAVNEFNFSGLGKAIAEGLNKFIKKTDFNKTGKLVAGFVNGAARTALTFAENFNFKGVGKSIATFINSALSGIKWKTILTAASAWGKGIAQAINSFFKETDFTLIGSTVGNFINTAINFALSAGKELDFKGIGQKIADGINGVFSTIDFAGLAETINTWVKGALTAVTTLLQETDFEAIGQKIGTFLAELDILSMMGQFAQMLWEAIKAGFSLLGGLIQEAPIETALIAAFAAFKFLGVGSIVAGGISKALVKNLAAKLGVDLLADSSITSVLSTALSTKLAPVLQTVSDKIGAIAPAVGVAVGSFVEFNVVSGAVENLTTSTGNFIAEIGKIVGAVGLAAAAFTAAFGFPAGVAIAAIAGIVGAIKGINDGFEEIRAEETGEIIKKALSEPGGTSISELTEKASSNIAEIGNSFSVVNTKSQELENAKANINNLVSEIDKIKTSIEAGVISTEEGTKKLNEAYSSLADAINIKIGAAGDTLLNVFGSNGASAKAFEAAGLNSDEMKKKVVSSMDETQKQVFSLAEELKNLRETDPTSKKIPELEQQLKDLAIGTSETDKALDDLEVQLNTNKLDWKDYLNADGFDTTKFQNDIGGMAQSVSTAKDTIKEDTGKILDAARELGDEEIYGEVKTALPDALEYMNGQVDSKVFETTDAFQNNLIGGINKVIDDAKEEWNNKNWFEKFFSGGNEASYVKSAIEDYKANYIDPASNQIETSMSEVGIEGAGWASDAAEDIISALFNEEAIRNSADPSRTITVLNSNWKTILSQMSKKTQGAARSAGKEVGETTSDGFSKGIDTKKAEKAGKDLASSSIKATRKELDSHSPSKVYKSIAEDVVNGFVNGLNENWKKVDDWWKKAKMPEVKFAIEDIKSKVSAKWKEVTDWWGESRKLKIDISFITNENNVSSWWEKIKNWWGKKKLEVSNDFKTTEPEVNKWWTNKVKSWWGTKKLEVDSKFITDENKDVKKWWTDKIKKWWGKKELEVGSDFITIKDEVVDDWWKNKVKKWWDTREVKVGTDYTTKEPEVNGWGKNTVKWLKDGISGAWGDFSKWFLDRFKSIVNKVVAGLNWVLKEVGSDDRVDKWTPKYAKGSSGLPQDTIGIVNDQSGNTYREMIVPPHGSPFIPKGRNVTLPMEKGTKIMPARQTKKFIESMPHFAKGIGKFSGNIFDYFDKPEKIIHIATDKFVDYSNLKKASLSISKGAVKTLENSSVDYIKKIFASAGGGAGIERAISWALKIAADDSHGYDQDSRWGPDYDCSSFVIAAFEQAGIKLKSANATYTGDMREKALKIGFTDVTKSVNLGTAEGIQRGDILLDEGNHVALYLGNGQLVHASINEKGTTRGGQTGDQNGREILTRGYYNHPWSNILRYTKGTAAGGGTTGGYTSQGEPDISVNYTPSAGVAQWRDVAIKALQLTGQYTPQNLVYLLEQMRHESDGNPYDVNTYDSNARAGNPSKGLMQVTPTTFEMCAMKGYDKDIFDPLSNIIAGIRWALYKYHSLYKAWPARGYQGYATGIGKINLTDIVKGFAKGGISKDELGVVNDQSGNIYKELVIPPHGTPFIPEGRNVTLPLEKGTRIIPADKTKKFLNSLPHFANGTEDFDGDKKSKSGGSGIVDGIRKVIDDTIIPYIREMIRILEGNAKNSGTTVATSNKKTTTKYSDTVKEIQKAWNDLAKWFETTVVQPIEATFATMKEQIIGIFSAINEDISKNYEEYSKEWQETLQEIPEWISEGISNSVIEQFQTLFSNIQDELSNAWSTTQDTLSEIPDWIETNITSSILSKFTDMFTQITDGFSTMWSDVSISASQELEKITGTADDVIGKLQEIIREANNAIATIERVTQAQNEAAIQAQVKQTTTDISNAVQEVTSQLGNSVISTAVASIGGFSNNIPKQETKQEETKKEEYETAKLQTINTSPKTGSLSSNIQYTTGAITSVAQETANVFETIKESTEETLDRLKNVAGKIKFKRYDTGGFPEDGWFRASKGEFMGQFDDGTSYVANNSQIQKAISAEVGGAVYNAVIAAMSSSGNNNGGDIVVNVDGESLFRIMKNKDNNFYSRTGKGAFQH